jgi:hypothetical protein
MSKVTKILSVFITLMVALVVVSATGSASGSEPPAKGLIVKKSVKTSFTRTWSWDISKKADRPSLSLKQGETELVNFGVVVRASSADSDWQMSGTISVLNPTDLTATITSVSDVADGVVADVTCSKSGALISFPYDLAPGWSIVCRYSADLPDGSLRTNVATVTTSGDVPGGKDTAAVTFGAPSTELDECVDVFDQHTGFLGTVCRDNAAFQYAWEVGPYQVCGLTKFANAAKVIANDSGKSKVSVAKIDVNVVCDDVTKDGEKSADSVDLNTVE